MSMEAGVTAQFLSWIITGIGIWFIAEMFVILSDVKPDLTAGLYKYAQVGFGSFTGFFSAWAYFVCECAANAAYAVLVMSTLDYFFPGTFTGGNNWPSVIGASIITWAITALVLRGVEVSSGVQLIFFAIMLAVVIVFLVSVLFHFNIHTFTTNMNATHSVPSVSDKPMGSVMHQLMNTMMVTLWLFGGIEGAVVMSGKAKNVKQVATATVIGFVICLVWQWNSIKMTLRSVRVQTMGIAHLEHELKKPLATMISAIGGMLKRKESVLCPTDEVKLGMIKARLMKMADITDTMLTSLKTSVLEVEREPIDLQLELEMITEMFTMIRKHARVEYHIAEGLGYPCLDKIYFNYIVINIVDNAIKYGGAHPVVKINFYEEGTDYILVVEDNGMGIAP